MPLTYNENKYFNPLGFATKAPRQGVHFRRMCKIVLEAHPPVMGEMVFATDTGEHGWLNEKGVLVWDLLKEDKTAEVTAECDCPYDHNGSGFTTLNKNYTPFLNVPYANVSVTYGLIMFRSVTLDSTTTKTIHQASGKVQIPNDLVPNEIWDSGIDLGDGLGNIFFLLNAEGTEVTLQTFREVQTITTETYTNLDGSVPYVSSGVSGSNPGGPVDYLIVTTTSTETVDVRVYGDYVVKATNRGISKIIFGGAV